MSFGYFQDGEDTSLDQAWAATGDKCPRATAPEQCTTLSDRLEGKS